MICGVAYSESRLLPPVRESVYGFDSKTDMMRVGFPRARAVVWNVLELDLSQLSQMLPLLCRLFWILPYFVSA